MLQWGLAPARYCHPPPPLLSDVARASRGAGGGRMGIVGVGGAKRGDIGCCCSGMGEEDFEGLMCIVLINLVFMNIFLTRFTIMLFMITIFVMMICCCRWRAYDSGEELHKKMSWIDARRGSCGGRW